MIEGVSVTNYSNMEIPTIQYSLLKQRTCTPLRRGRARTNEQLSEKDTIPKNINRYFTLRPRWTWLVTSRDGAAKYCVRRVQEGRPAAHPAISYARAFRTERDHRAKVSTRSKTAHTTIYSGLAI